MNEIETEIKEIALCNERYAHLIRMCQDLRELHSNRFVVLLYPIRATTLTIKFIALMVSCLWGFQKKFNEIEKKYWQRLQTAGG